MIEDNQGKIIGLLFMIFTLGSLTAKAQQKVGGKITDARSGESLPGVNILVKGTSTGASTDVNGHYELEVESLQDTLVVSFVGYKTRQVPVNGRTEIDVALQKQAITGEEMVVIGYGTQEQQNLTTSISSISENEFAGGINENPAALMEGKLSGVTVNQNNAEPGGGFSVSIRGAGSINSSNQALYIVDGVPMTSSPDNLNPGDIKSIDVLKGAAAAAIYGTRAANGVVLMTTKKGEKGATEVNYNASIGYQTPASKLDVLNATQYMQMRNYFSEKQGQKKPFTKSQIDAESGGTNWQDELFRNAWVTNHQLSVSGGSDDSRFYTSVGYLNQNGVVISSGNKKYTASVNYQATPSNKFKFNLHLNGAVNNKDLVANRTVKQNEFQGPIGAAVKFNPTIPAAKDENGKYRLDPIIALDNPLAMATGYHYGTNKTGLVGNISGEYTIANNLRIKLQGGMHRENLGYDRYQDRTTKLGLAQGGIGSKQVMTNNHWLAEGTLHYTKGFSENHHLTLLGGISYEKFVDTQQSASASEFISDITKTNLLGSGTKDTYDVGSSKSNHKLQSIFGRAQYNYQNKYFVSGSIRADGSSRFSEQHKYAIFPSATLGWRITNEPFMSGLISVLSNLKLKISYGQVGNEGISNFETIQTLVAGGSALLGGTLRNGLLPARIPNPDLRWERTEEYNFGLDFGFLENRISGTVEYYIKNTSDQLLQKPVPLSTGFRSVRTNFGNVRNAGIDLSIKSINIQKPFLWKTNLTLSMLNNEVTKLPPFIGEHIITGALNNGSGNAYNYAIVQEGDPLRAYYGYKIQGIFQKNDNIANSAQPNARAGDPKFLDANQDGKITPDDRVILGSPYPDYQIGFSNTFSYKNIKLSADLTARLGNQTLNGNVAESLLPINSHRNIISRYYLDRWTPNNTDTNLPSGVDPTRYFGNGQVINSYTVQDASYMRLRNLRLGYQLIPKTDAFRSAEIYIAGANLFTITNFEGFDPVGNQVSSGKLNSNSSIKTSYNNYPVARSFRLGINFKF